MNCIEAIDPSFTEELLAWHRGHMRDLPWNGETDPYRIWISEIMLQQTRVETVKPYYLRFLNRFPSVFELAACPEDELMTYWQGLGYYSRAKNLKKAAEIIVSEHNGVFPRTQKQLLELPGIGMYTSCAIASMAYGDRLPSLDGNHVRVLSRLLDIDTPIKSAELLWDTALELMPKHDCGLYNQALMGLSALVCLPKKPRCGECPIQKHCLARYRNTAEMRPVKVTKPEKQHFDVQIALILDSEGQVFMRKREAGLLSGLWEFPFAEEIHTPSELDAILAESGYVAERIGKVATNHHVFTHKIWDMTAYIYKTDSSIQNPPNSRWIAIKDLNTVGIATAFKTFVVFLQNRPDY